MSLPAGGFDWPPPPGRAGSVDGSGLSKLRVSAGSRCNSSLLMSRELGSVDLDGESCSGGSPHRGAGRGHRTEPFFIGVAGGTASGAQQCVA